MLSARRRAFGYGVVTILYSGSMLYAIYDLHNVKYIGKRVLTNTPPCGAFRGHGTVDVRFAFESLLDEMAHELGLDPMAVRRANYLTAPTFTDNDLMVNSYGLPECVDWVEQASGWRARKGKLPKARAGLCLLALHQRGLEAGELDRRAARHRQDQARFRRLDRRALGRGRYRPGLVHHPGADGGRGARARPLAHPRRHRRQRGGAEGQRLLFSRVTFMVGNAAIDAAQNLKRVLVAAAARKLEAKPDDIECLGELYRAGAQDKGLTFNEVVTEALKDTGTITVTGNYSTIPESHGGKKYRGAAIGGTMGYSYSAQVVEVSVDEETGVVTVDKVWVAHDCGKALNRLRSRARCRARYGWAWARP